LLGLEHTLADIEGLAFVRLGTGDVVRHRIVADIVAAYGRQDEREAERTAARKTERKTGRK
jgi:phosphate starvation-inducible PhoH-like protein